ncbi:MAG: Ig-like domain-containing protein, partial [Oleiphilaceae bacterium]|nr:Ig-like domain-containing protein [Oleiphilaceae bacterium]
YRAMGTVLNDPGNPIDVTSRVRWSTSNSSVATINSAGILTGQSAGLVNVRAEWADLNDSKELTVSNALLQSIDIGDIPAVLSECAAGYQLSATGNYDDGSSRNITNNVIWTTDDLTRATITEDGVLTTLSSGAINLIASRDDLNGTEIREENAQTIQDNLTDIVVTPTNASITVGQAQQYTATGTYSNDSDRVITEAVTWTSAEPTIVQISNDAGAKGFAEALAAGSTSVTASCNPSDSFANDTVPVTAATAASINAVVINNGDAEVEVNLSEGNVQLEAHLRRSDATLADRVTESDDITWSVSATIEGTAATVSNTGNDKGLVSFTATGITEIRVRYDSGTLGPFTDTIEVEVK